MKINEIPEKIFLERRKETNKIHHLWGRTPVVSSLYEHIEYTRTDAFIEKARKWFEKQNEWRDLNGIKHCDMENFEDFRNYMKGE